MKELMNDFTSIDFIGFKFREVNDDYFFINYLQYL